MAEKQVLFLTSHASRGGIINYTNILRERLKIDAFEVQTVALYRGDNADSLPNMQILSEARHLGFAGYCLTFVKLLVLCARFRPAVIIGCMPLANVFAGIASILFRLKSIATHHNPVENQNQTLEKIDAVFGTFGFYDRIICVSEVVAQSFSKHSAAYRKRIDVIRNGMPLIVQSRPSSETRKAFSLGDSEVVALIAGRLSAQKNVVSAVRAMIETQNLTLLLTGDGELKGEIEQIIRDHELAGRVRLLGVLNKQDLVDLLFAVDLFVQVSLYEGHSAALLEAIYARLPLVVSNVPTQVEAVTLPDGRVAAVLCDPFAPSDIARAMEVAAFDACRRTELAGTVEILAHSLRTEPEVLNDYVALIGTLLNVPSDGDNEIQAAS